MNTELPTDAEIKAVIDRAFAPFDAQLRKLDEALAVLQESQQLMDALKKLEQKH